MEHNKEALTIIEQLAEQSGKYKKEAYLFVFEALDYTLRKLQERRHVTGRELSYGISAYAKAEYGPMAKTVFEYWGITRTEDFGRIVFDLVEAGLMSKTDSDCIDDFKNIYDFEDEFGKKQKERKP